VTGDVGSPGGAALLVSAPEGDPKCQLLWGFSPPRTYLALAEALDAPLLTSDARRGEVPDTMARIEVV
jgi:hypothetical protein